MTFPELPPSWRDALASDIATPAYRDLVAFVASERKKGDVFPPPAQVFTAFEHTPFDRVNVLLLGQDPYHGPGQAHGVALSVPPGVPIPPSLANMFKELATDVGFRVPDNGCLLPWADQGMLLVNAVLTVRAGETGSHANKGWEAFTDAVIRALDARERPLVFVLWGNYAKKKAKLIDAKRHRVLEGVHPSPLSAHAGFFGSKPFSAIDEALRSLGSPPMVWQLPDTGIPIVKVPRSGGGGPTSTKAGRAAGAPATTVTEATATLGATLELKLPKGAFNLKGDWIWFSPSAGVFVVPTSTGFAVRSSLEGPPLHEIPRPAEAPFPSSPQPPFDEDPPEGLQNGAVNDAGDRLALITDKSVMLVDRAGKVLRSISVFAEENEDDEDAPEWLGIPHAVCFDAGGKLVWLATIGEGGGLIVYGLDAKSLKVRGELTLLDSVPTPAFVEVRSRPGGNAVVVDIGCGQDGSGFWCAEWKKKAVVLAAPHRWEINRVASFSSFADDGVGLFVRRHDGLSRYEWGTSTPSVEAPGGIDGPAGVLGGWFLVSALPPPRAPHVGPRQIDVLDPKTLTKRASFTLPTRSFDRVLADGSLLSVGRSEGKADLAVVRVALR